MSANKYKAVALLSGGLDSTLAVKLMIDQGIDVTAVHFTSVFCNCTPRTAGCKMHARNIAEEFGIQIHVIHKGMDYMKIVENPPHGYGRAMNVCIDCRIYMLRKVKELMAGWGASFVITGEVLGQRPMSQQRHTICLIERESGLEDLILRPLSAQYFDPTLPEREGIVDREKLLNISGRSRKPQFELAEKLGVKDYPCPAGGCLLTDKEMAARLRDLFNYIPDYDIMDLHFLKIGRHFRLNPQQKIIVGRTHEDNEKIESFAKPGSLVFSPSGFRGPTVYLRNSADTMPETAIGRIIARYSQDNLPEYPIRKRIVGGKETFFAVYDRFPAEILETHRISS